MYKINYIKYCQCNKKYYSTVQTVFKGGESIASWWITLLTLYFWWVSLCHVSIVFWDLFVSS